MNCTNPKMKKLISPYLLNVISDEDREKLESHILHCQDCFDEIYQINEYFVLMEDHPQDFIAAIQKKKSFAMRLLEVFAPLPIYISHHFKNFFSAPKIKILVPLTIACLIAVFFLWPRQQNVSDLAILEKAPYINFRSEEPLQKKPNSIDILIKKAEGQKEQLPSPPIAKGQKEQLPSPPIAKGQKEQLPSPPIAKGQKEQLPSPPIAKGQKEQLPSPPIAKGQKEQLPSPPIGLGLLKINDSSRIKSIIDSNHIETSQDAYYYFHLGVRQLMNNDLENGIKTLQKAAILSEEQGLTILKERCFWYLANGYLKLDRKDEALKYFNKIIELKLYFYKRAQKQIERIKARESKRNE